MQRTGRTVDIIKCIFLAGGRGINAPKVRTRDKRLRGSSSSSGSSSASRSGNTPAVVAPSTELQNPRESQESIEHLGTQLDTCGLEGISEETHGIEIHEESSSSSLGFVEKVSSNSEETVLKKVDEKEEEKVDRQSGSNVICTTAHQVVHSCPPAPPVPPPKPVTGLSSRRLLCSGSSTGRSGGTRRSFRSSPTASRPSSPRSLGDDGYNSADEQNPCFAYYYDAERERQFEIDLMRSKGLEVRRMVADGNCLFRAVADQVYGDEEVYDDTRQMCIDYMEKERDHFSQFVTESFSAYCKRKRRDKVYGNNLEIQAMSEMYNRPIHIYSYSTDPINIFHGNYSTDSPPIRLSYHRGNHYNSLVDPHHMTVGAGLGFSNLQGKDIDKEKVKATIKAQQDHQIESALLAEGRFYSDLELTQKELERMVMETSKNEYIAKDKCKQQLGGKASSTSTNAEPSSSAARPPSIVYDPIFQNAAIPTSVQTVASMGFDHVKVLEAHSIFGDDVEAMVYYLLETGGNSFCGENIYRMKGKATEK